MTEDNPPPEYSEIFDNPQENDPEEEEVVFDHIVNIIAEAKEKIMGTDEERKERKRINEEIFQKNIFCQLKDASLWFQFNISYDKKRDFSKLEKLTEGEKLKTLKFWNYWLFSCLEGLEKYKINYLKKIDQLQKESQDAREERYISEVRFEVINDEINIERRSLMSKYYQIVFEICEDLRKIHKLLI